MAVPLMAQIREVLCTVAQQIRRQYFNKVWHMDIGEGAKISSSAKLDKTNPRGIHIGKYSVVAFGAAILSHDGTNEGTNDWFRDVHIGDYCFIGAHSIVLAGVTIGDNCIVAPMSLVVRNVPAGCLVAGNPARVLEKNVKTTRYGIRVREQTVAQPLPQEAVPCTQ